MSQMDRQEATWLADLIVESLRGLPQGPGLTVEVEEQPRLWIQVLPQMGDEPNVLSGYTINFPYRGYEGDPLAVIQAKGLTPPPDTRTLDWSDGEFAMIWVRPDVLVVAFAHFLGDILERVIGSPEGRVLTVRIEFGY
ncbi:MAG: hypothetical protein GYB68_14150 [Chloroflexi bacterium]|nr:hypothetical protein [Chloroflexota bacterium]